MILKFTIPGVARGKSRPKFASRGKFVHAYQPKEDKVRESQIQAAYRAAFSTMTPHDGPVAVNIEAIYTVPDSWSDKKKLTPGPKVSKPDLDNVVKSVLDALNKIAWKDDSQIIRITSGKRWGARNETAVTIERIGHSADLFAEAEALW